MLVTLQILCSGEPANQLLRVVNENGQVLRADPELLILVLNRQQWSFLAALLANQTGMDSVVHKNLHEI
jgi:hypothetical protein